MSRRYTDRNLAPVQEVSPEDAEAAWQHFEAAGIPWWYATEMPYPWDGHLWHQWASAWAEVTLSVVEGVWHRQGARIYAVHRDVLLRDDLRSWLVVAAVEAGKDFIPDPWHPAPHKNYGAWLRGRLTDRTRRHFGQVVGRSHTPSGQAATDAHNNGIRSTQHLEEIEAADGGFINRHPLYTPPFEAADPAHVIIRLEELVEQVEQIEREDRRQGLWSTSTVPVGAPCLEQGCDSPVMARGLCRSHYNKARYQAADNCTEDGCTRPGYARGLCSRHYREHRAQAVAAGTWTTYDTPEGCSEEGCTATKVEARGLCRRHYEAHRRATAPPCTVDDCGRPADRRGMCNLHYRRWRKARDKGEGETYP